MRGAVHPLFALLALALAASCGGGGGATTPSPPATPTPTPTPEPAGTIRLLDSSLPDGSTVEVFPMHEFGQQAPALQFSAAVNLDEDLTGGLVQAFVRTDEHRCMGGGHAHLDFPAGVDILAEPLSMSHPANPLPPCTLPYSTTHVEFLVFGPGEPEPLLEAQFPAVYHFVEGS